MIFIKDHIFKYQSHTISSLAFSLMSQLLFLETDPKHGLSSSALFRKYNTVAVKTSKKGSEAEKYGKIMRGDVFQQGIFMRQLHEMSPNGLFRVGICSLVQSIEGRMGKEIYLPDPSHVPSSIALSLPSRDLIPPYSQVALLSPCSSCSGSQISCLQRVLHLSPEVL